MMRYKHKCFFAVAVIPAVMITVIAIHQCWLASLRAHVTTEINTKAGLVIGDLESVIFAEGTNPATTTDMLRLLLNARAPTNWLQISRCRIEPEAWEIIGQMRWLRHLSLSHTNVRDDDLVHIRQLTKLYSLSLAGTAVSDRGLANLRDLKALREISVRETKVTENGLRDVQKHFLQLGR